MISEFNGGMYDIPETEFSEFENFVENVWKPMMEQKWKIREGLGEIQG